MKLNTKYLILLIIPLIILFFIFKKTNKQDTSLPPNTEYSQKPNIGSTTNKSAVVPNKASTTETKPVNQSQENKIASPKRGLCEWNDKLNQNLIPIELLKLIQTQQIKKVILPVFHSRCLKEKTKQIFKIVKYDFRTDSAYDYLGNVEIEFSAKKKYNLFSDLSEESGYNFKDYGFSSTRQAYEFINSLGGDLQGIEVLNISSVSFSNPRSPNGIYNFYPGTILDTSIPNASDLVFLNFQINKSRKDLNNSSKKENSSTDKTNILIDKVPFSSELQVPLQASAFLKQTNPQLIPSLQNKPVVFTQNSISDLRPYTFSSVFNNRKVYIYQKFLSENQGPFTKETPKLVVWLNQISVSELFNKYSAELIIDTRPNNKKVIFKNAWNAPLFEPIIKSYPSASVDETITNKNVYPDELRSLETKYDWQRIRRQSKKRSIIFIGQDDYDWKPVILAKLFYSQGFTNLIWLRDGFTGISLNKELGLLNEKQLSLLSDESQLIYQKVKIDTKNNNTAFKEGIIVQNQKTNSNRNSFLVRKKRNKK